ncbi:MAG: TlpA disulfide reductase family protein [Pseudoflavonifractor sp.]
MKLRTLTCGALALLLAAGLSGCTADEPALPSATPPAASAAPAEPMPILADFTASDLEGIDRDQTIFEGYKLTMVNVWATYCGPCLGEMPDLGALHGEYADQGFQVVGIVTDVLNQDGSVSEDQVATAQDVVASTGADYLHLMPSQDLNDSLLYQVSAVPTTIFVDESGNLVGEGYLGARSKDGWAAIIDGLLDEVSK